MDSSKEFSPDPYAPKEDGFNDAEATTTRRRRQHRADIPTPGELLMAVSDRWAPSKHTTALRRAASEFDRELERHEKQGGADFPTERAYFDHCVSSTLTTAAIIDSGLSGAFGWVGWKIVKIRGAQQPFKVVVPVAMALLPWLNLFLASNRLLVCENCYLAVMASPSRAGSRMRREYGREYPDSAVLLGAQSLARSSDTRVRSPFEAGGSGDQGPGTVTGTGRAVTYEEWLGRAQRLAPLVPREPSQDDLDRRPRAGGFHERPNAGPFGLPWGSPSSIVRLPVAHAMSEDELERYKRAHRQEQEQYDQPPAPEWLVGPEGGPGHGHAQALPRGAGRAGQAGHTPARGFRIEDLLGINAADSSGSTSPRDEGEEEEEEDGGRSPSSGPDREGGQGFDLAEPGYPSERAR